MFEFCDKLNKIWELRLFLIGTKRGYIKGFKNVCPLGAKWSEGVRILERERELTEALRRVQQEEGRSIQLQKELLQQFREMDAERRVLQNQKSEQEQEHARLQKEKEDLQKEKNELQREKEEVQKEREEIQKEKEELEKQKQELDSWKNSHAQGQTTGFYNCWYSSVCLFHKETKISFLWK